MSPGCLWCILCVYIFNFVVRSGLEFRWGSARVWLHVDGRIDLASTISPLLVSNIDLYSSSEQEATGCQIHIALWNTSKNNFTYCALIMRARRVNHKSQEFQVEQMITFNQ